MENETQHSMTTNGESCEVKGKNVDSWEECIPEIIHGYSAEDIWKMDETGCFWRAYLGKSLGQTQKIYKGSKECKMRGQAGH